MSWMVGDFRNNWVTNVSNTNLACSCENNNERRTNLLNLFSATPPLIDKLNAVSLSLIHWFILFYFILSTLPFFYSLPPQTVSVNYRSSAECAVWNEDEDEDDDVEYIHFAAKVEHGFEEGHNGFRYNDEDVDYNDKEPDTIQLTPNITGEDDKNHF